MIESRKAKCKMNYSKMKNIMNDRNDARAAKNACEYFSTRVRRCAP